MFIKNFLKVFDIMQLVQCTPAFFGYIFVAKKTETINYYIRYVLNQNRNMVNAKPYKDLDCFIIPLVFLRIKNLITFIIPGCWCWKKEKNKN